MLGGTQEHTTRPAYQQLIQTRAHGSVSEGLERFCFERYMGVTGRVTNHSALTKAFDGLIGLLPIALELDDLFCETG